MDLAIIRAKAAEIAQQAGAVLMSFFDQPHQQQAKRTPTDIVTEGDTESEAVIVAALTEAFPGHHIISEEGGGMGARPEDAEYVWYVDPLDGTSNYASNIPYFSVSMALSDRHMQPLVGVVYDPFTRQLFTAARGEGATLNGRPLWVSKMESLGSAMLSTGFPYDIRTNLDNNVREWNALIMQTRGVRQMESAALNLAYVGAGRFDGHWEPRLKPWDVQAGILIVREAGGLVTDYSGNESDLMLSGEEIIASNGVIHEVLLGAIAAARAGQRKARAR